MSIVRFKLFNITKVNLYAVSRYESELQLINISSEKSQLYTYRPEFEINIQNCMYKPELHEKQPIIFAS